jgi:mono/diheme cytochrome c family protein
MKIMKLLGLFLLVIPVAGMHAEELAGKQDYMQFCAGCHGVDGTGMQAIGKKGWEYPVPPPDLTHMSQSNGGYFPYVKVRKIIDGRPEKANQRGHYEGDMPVWGRVFVDQSNGNDIHKEAVAKMRILNIVDYLVSIQEIDLIKVEPVK